MKTTKLFAKSIIVLIVVCSHTGFAQKSQDIMKKEKVIKEYYTAYVEKDWHKLELILAEGFTFSSPAGDDHINLKLYKERCWPNSNNSKSFDLEKVMIDGDDAYVTYNGRTNDDRHFETPNDLNLKRVK